MQFDEGELDGLVVREGCAEGSAGVGIGDGGLDAVDCRAEGGCGLTDAVLVDERLGDGEAGMEGAEDGAGGNEDVVEGYGGVVGGHIECPGLR